jgi:N-dimethylarginine dimethylaminohydrolase
MRPNRILMASTDHFDVLYAINPYMKTAEGGLQKIDRDRSRAQWQALKALYQQLSITVEVIPGLPGFPDFVFCANQSFPYWNPARSRPSVILSRMRSKERQGEVEAFEDWYKQRGYEIQTLSGVSSFEGNGDALIQYSETGPIIWGGYGPRTDRAVYREIGELTGFEVIELPLLRPEFYHLDTCFSILNVSTVVIQPDAFPPEALRKIYERFSRVIETSQEDCARFFTGNCHSPNGRDVVLQAGCLAFETKLRDAGFMPCPLDTSEFLKSGGSVFCMKMEFFA